MILGRAEMRLSHWRRLAGQCGVALVLLLTSLAAAVQAQDREVLLREIEHTERVLTRAREVVEHNANPRAIEHLRAAVHLQERAVALLSTGGPLATMRVLDFTRRARDLAQRAMNITGEHAQFEQRARAELERLDHALEATRQHAAAAPSERLQRLIDIATRRLERAREAFHEQRYEEAMTMARDVRRLLEDIGGVARDSGRLDHALGEIHRLLERTREAVEAGHDPRARTWVEEAEALVEQAEANLASGRPEATARLIAPAREILLRALRLSDGAADPSRVDRMLEETAAFVERVGQAVQDTGHEGAARLVATAREHLDKAVNLRQNGALPRAVAEARVARNLARRGLDLAGLGEL